MNDKQEQFETLVRQHGQVLFRYAMNLSGGARDVAEDLVQDTLMRAWRRFDQLADASAAKSWLLTILRRENARRFERKRFDYSDIELETLGEDRPDPQTLVEQDELIAAVLDLGPSYAMPLLMQAVLGCSADEIGGELGLARNAVHTRIYRAKRQLVPELDQLRERRGTRAALAQAAAEMVS